MGNYFSFFISLLLSVAFFKLHSQELPVYNHYYNNAYLFNPAETGADGYMKITLNHRQQWLGIEGAPMISTLTFETPSDYKQWALGFHVRNFERGLLTTTDFLATYAYTAYLTKTTTLHLGMSFGAISNSINLNEIDDATDPILNEFLDNNIQLVGRAGAKLTSANGFNLGIVMPNLLHPEFVNDQNFSSYEFSPLNELMVMAYFKRKLERKIVTRKVGGIKRRIKVDDAYAPLQFYALYKYSKFVDQRIELLAKLDLSENGWVGGAYRFKYGFSGLFGFKIKNFIFSYSYEPASKLVSGLAQGTHEVQLGFTIGEKKKLERTKPILRTVQKKIDHSARFNVENSEVSAQAGVSNEKTYYVVLKTFNVFEGADNYLMKVKKDTGINTDIYHNKKNNKFYVYIFKSTKNREAKKELRAVEELTKFKRVQIIEIE